MNRMEKAAQVIGLGQACVDYRGRLISYPREDEKAELTDLFMECGGPASTALVTLGRLGVPTSFLGSISDDLFGEEIRKHLEKEGVDRSCLSIKPGYTSQFAFIAITEKSGNRTIFWHKGTVPHLKPEEIDIGRFPNASVLHLDGLMVEASCEAARQAKALGMTVVLDGGTMREGTRELLSLVDILIASEKFAAPLMGGPPTESLEALRKLGPAQVVITLGSKGSIGLDNQEIIRAEAFKVDALDTTGAGDVYHGAYIYGLLQQWDMRRCMRFASAAAALKCQKMGSRSGIPRLEEIEGLMKHTS
ncbi:MAG: PfkB family carbohydrate kinase [Desulfatiglans sp.]|jgi:ribokinase|nr:PfkB family carbohydrate kinase [Thermodesulfobacteriota bacterium]MEE4354658.1 PfkB family carbohydrate kinase [Desulfatiglans sp.]